MSDQFKYINQLEIQLVKPDTNEITTVYNSTSDDFLCGFGAIYSKCAANNQNYMQAVIFPDGPAWSGYTWNPRDPWIPYSCLPNKPDDPSASSLNQTPTVTYDSVNRRFKYYYQWLKLDYDFNLRAIGLTLWDYFDAAACGCAAAGYHSYPVGALAVLPSAIPIKGQIGGTQTPDILQVSYYISLVGV